VSSELSSASENTSFLLDERDRHLKWRSFDIIEKTLVLLSGLCIVGFTLSVFFDVTTRLIQAPWLWLQQATTGFFAYGVFIGMAVASRRNEHMYLTEFVANLSGSIRRKLEIFSRLVCLVVALLMIYFGWLNMLHDMGSFRMPSLIPMGYYTASVPLCAFFIAIFMIEQLYNGIKNGFDNELNRSKP
jgi:TRAP-type C4-dicarboxylate transport system permease small subunit